MLTSVVLTRACEGGSGCNLRPPFGAHRPHRAQNSSPTLSWAPWPFLDLFFWISYGLNATQKNAHARFSKSSTCAPICFWAQNSLFGRFHHVCTRSCGVQKCVGRTHLRFSVSEFPDAHCLTRKNRFLIRVIAKNNTAFFANSRITYLTQLGLFFNEQCLFFIILE